MKFINKNKHSYLRYWFVGIMLLFLVTGALFFSSSAISEEGAQVGRLAPINKEFLRYLEDKKLGIIWSNYSDDGHPLGHLPSPIDISYPQDISAEKIEYLPSSYDLRNKGKLTKIRDQGDCGSCWAFATYGSLESYFLPGETCDFSEQHLIDNHGFDPGPCEGGNNDMSTAYLARWDGPRKESDFPYEYTYEGAKNVQKHVQNVIFIPTRKSSTDNNKIKNAVMDYGALYVSMYYSGSCYNLSNNSYYNPNIASGGHAVAVVGWNDNFSKNKFNTTPPGNGAFIVRNSWGKSYGENGYFYVSYYDKYFARRGFSAVFQADATTNYKTVYDYDPLGWTISLGFTSGKKDTSWFANIFKAKKKASLRAVSFYAGGTTNNYEIYVYTNVKSNKPRSGKLAVKIKGKKTLPGYYTIPLKKKVSLKKGKKFSVVVKLKTKKWNYPIPLEYKISGYSSKVKAKAGESFYSQKGSTWKDAGTIYKANVCIKAFVK